MAEDTLNEQVAEEGVEKPAEAVDEAPAAPAEEEAYDEDEYEDTEDSLTYSNGVIENALSQSPWPRARCPTCSHEGQPHPLRQETLGAKDLTKGVSVEVTDDNRVVVNISVIIEYGCYAPAIFEDVKKRVTERLTEMTGLEIAGINLRIEDVVTLEAYNESKKRYVDSQKKDEAAE